MAAEDLVDLEGLGRRPAPRPLGEFMLQTVLGRGGMGMVWLATRRADDGGEQPCVVKTLRVEDDPEYERRFIDEVRLLALLAHPNICGVVDAGCFEGQYYLAMEHIDGLDLKRVAALTEQSGAPLPAAVVVYVARQVLLALDSAHRTRHPATGEPLKVVHRDVSPQNVMLGRDGSVKLIDFGLALSTQKVEKTAPSVVMGKIAYMSPEQARGEAIDGRADQFAVGVLLYELLTNTRYYEGLSLDETWRKSGSGGHVPLRWSALHPGLRAVIKCATAPVAGDRYASCAAMADALSLWAREERQPAAAADAMAALGALRAATHFADGPTGERPRVTSFAGRHAVVDEPARPREPTRTFRLRDLEGTPLPAPSPATTWVEPTLLVRASDLRPPGAPKAGEPPWRRTLAAVAAGLAVAVIVAAAFLARDRAAAKDIVLVALVADAGSVAVNTGSVVLDAGAAGASANAGSAVPDAGSAVPDAGSAIVDAGAAGAIVDAGVVAKVPGGKAFKSGGRALPAWPANAVFRQAAVLRAHCRDVDCTAPLLRRLARPDGPARKALDHELWACYVTCRKTSR
ncbi:MAG: serine/threonine protein kinase [Deltaproteobacteria bacterium]|nr:serine/threonine protein kinase [Deltaproteobacteria bacterium]